MELLIVGLDGLSFNMLRRFDVETDFLSDLRSAGVSGHLRSVDTPTTLPAWTSFATGKDPGSHGVSNMVRQAPDYGVSPSEPNATDAAAYDLLSDALFVNLPASSGRVPAAEDTRVVSSMLAADAAEAVPAELRSLDAYDDYVVDHDASLKVRPDRYREHLADVAAARHRFAREAFERFDPRVGFVLFSATDWAGHALATIPDRDDRRDFYADLVGRVDGYAADLAGMADNVVLMSDHGFEHKRANVHLGDWLADEGYAAVTADRSLAGLAVSAATAVAGRSERLYGLIRRVHNMIMGTGVGASLHEAASPTVDYPNSTAWQLRYGCVYVNDDRFDSPRVDDPGRLAARIRDDLRDLRDDDGERVFRDVLLAAEAYADPGPGAPDVLARPAPGYFPTTVRSPTGGYTSPTDNYEHRYRGVFAARGPLFAAGEVEGMGIVDVLPTVLAALDEPLAPDFDGEVRRDVLGTDADPGYLSPDAVPDPRFSRDDRPGREAVVEERLADLGYVE